MAELKPGDRIVPGAQLGIDNFGIGDNRNVSLTTNADEARGHGIHVYEVHPGPVQAVHATSGFGPHDREVRVSHATVRREVTPPGQYDYMPAGPVEAYEREHRIGTYAPRDTKALLTVNQAVAANRTAGKLIPQDGTPVTAVPSVVTSTLDYQARAAATGAPAEVHGPLATTRVHTAFGSYVKCVVDGWDVDPATIRAQPEQSEPRPAQAPQVKADGQPRDERGRFMGDTLGADPQANQTVAGLAGAGLAGMFPGEESQALTPWRTAGGLRGRAPYERDKVEAAVADRDYPLRQIDPRVLTATQGGLGRAGVDYYLNDPEYRATGTTFADRHLAGNAVPVVYSRTNPNTGRVEHLILSGHHRAAAALLAGRPLVAKHVEGGYGPGHVKAFDDSEPRDDHGRWTDGGGGFVDALGRGIADGGFSIRPGSGQAPSDGYMVAVEGRTMQPIIDADQFRSLPPEEQVDRIDRWVGQNMDLFANGRTYVGGWVDPATNLLHLDPAEQIAARGDATRLGRDRNQIAVYDVERGVEIPTGGTGDKPTTNQLV